MKNHLHAGVSSAVAVALFLGLGASSGALAQVQAPLPVIKAPDLKTGVSTSPLQPVVPQNILTHPLRPAPVRPAPLPLPLSAMVDAQGSGGSLDEQANCLATAVYFESMGESLEGQLAVAQVVINRANSGRYPTSWCAVVKQKAQFSFVRAGAFPRVNASSEAWRKARAIAVIAANNMAKALPSDVLWYHADYVAPGWGRRLVRAEKIGAHIFYRS